LGEYESWLLDAFLVERRGFHQSRRENVGRVSRFCNARLTLKGLTLLGYAAPSIDGEPAEETFADRARKVIADGGREAAVETVKDLLRNALRLGVGLLA